MPLPEPYLLGIAGRVLLHRVRPPIPASPVPAACPEQSSLGSALADRADQGDGGTRASPAGPVEGQLSKQA
jgi:hypothetical protein